MSIFFSTLLALVCLLLGFAWGRRRGLAAGRQVGLAETPLLLRQESAVAGICHLCGHVYGKNSTGI